MPSRSSIRVGLESGTIYEDLVILGARVIY